MKLHARLAAALALLFSFVLTTRAQTITTWISGGAANDLTDTLNWNNGVPEFPPPYETSGLIVGRINGGATVTVSSSPSLYFDMLDVGTNGSNGTLNVNSGAELYAARLSYGQDSGTTGSGTISGGGSIYAGLVLVGEAGTGNLTISSGGAVNTTVYAGNSSGGSGTVLVTGSGSSVSGLSGGAGSAGITVENSAEVSAGLSSGAGNFNATVTDSSVGGGVSIFTAGSSTVTFANSTLNGSIDLRPVTGGTSSLTFDSSSTFTGGDIRLGAASDATATAIFEGGSHQVGAIKLDGPGSNTLTVRGGTTLADNGGGWVSRIGDGSGSNGTMILQAGTWNTGSGASLEIGRDGGTGTFTMETAATANFDSVNAGAGSSGGNGTLNVTGASVLTARNAGGIGLTSGSTGTVSVYGSGSQWNIANGLQVGSSGAGSLAISAGGAVTTGTTTTIGGQSGSSGSISVSGSGSSYTSGGTVTMGNGSGATSSLTLSDGGLFTITNGNLLLGNNPTGTAALNIGAAANQAAGAPGYLAFTTVDPNPGTLAAGHIRSAWGTGTVVFNHTGSNYTFGAVMDFEVDILHKAGTTLLTGGTDIHGLTGHTTLTGGTLRLGINQAIGTGNLILGGGTLDLNDFSQTAGTLNVTGNTFIDFTGTSQLLLADSSALSWSGILTVLNFDGSDSFRVGTTSGGLTGTQLNLINIGGFYAQIDNAGYLSASTTAIPEPAAYAVIAGLLALGLAARRCRLLPARPDC